MVERHRARAAARRQTLNLNEGPADLAVWADEEAVDQILDNLLDNAVKYTPEGGRVTVGWRGEDGQVAVEVADTGIGIPDADLPRVFERFYRVDKARSREMGGTGLGLSIVKHLVQAMHGSVRAASRLGQGTTFTVRCRATPDRDFSPQRHREKDECKMQVAMCQVRNFDVRCISFCILPSSFLCVSVPLW